jgi:hypothetical protein
MKKMLLPACLLACAVAAPAFANDVVVTPADTSWTTSPSEDTNGGNAAITNTAAHDGNGSLEMTGDRSRYWIGTLYPNSASSQIALLSDVTALTFDWMIASDSSNGHDPDYTPALRLHIFDAGSGTRKELIWEGAYNNVYGSQTNPDTWYSTSATDKFYISGGNVNAGKTIADWASSLAAGSFVAGISVGHGSSAGPNYHAFADDVTFSTTHGSTTFNFETAGAVPEPASWALMIGGFGLVGASMRRRRSAVTFG